LRVIGLLDNSPRGTWRLTEEGLRTHFDMPSAQIAAIRVRAIQAALGKGSANAYDDEPRDATQD